jgi:Lysyl oxidase
MRWVAVLVVSAVGVALGAIGLLLLRDDGPGELLPDLQPAAPTQVEIVEEGDSYGLVFVSAVDNVGLGPLLIEGKRQDRDQPAMSVLQLARRTDGSTRSRPVPGEIRLAAPESDAGWQLLDFAIYELRSAVDGKLVQPEVPLGFCLADRYDTADESELAGEPERPVWIDRCGGADPGLLELRAGISPGFGTFAEARGDDQVVDVTNVPAGRYLLVQRANPERALEESDYENNAASVLIQLRRAGVIPSVRVLARCPGTDTCAPG